MEPSMSNIDRRTLVKGSLAAMMAGAAFSRNAFAQSSEPILLGVSGPLTGPNAQYGTQWKQGFDLALDENMGGGRPHRPTPPLQLQGHPERPALAGRGGAEFVFHPRHSDGAWRFLQ